MVANGNIYGGPPPKTAAHDYRSHSRHGTSLITESPTPGKITRIANLNNVAG